VKRVVVTGSECTGKTTAAAALAATYGVPWVPEAARAVAEARGGGLTIDDVGPIARAHLAAAERVGSTGAALVFLDTDLISTVVYSRHYYGACPRWIERAARDQLADLYLLHRPDIPWVPDASRDRGHLRDVLHALFVDALSEFGASAVEVGGSGDARLAQAARAVDRLVAGV
jgi:NadR type nicotinamide-nucleotide adenylyltransferase